MRNPTQDKKNGQQKRDPREIFFFLSGQRGRSAVVYEFHAVERVDVVESTLLRAQDSYDVQIRVGYCDAKNHTLQKENNTMYKIVSFLLPKPWIYGCRLHHVLA